MGTRPRRTSAIELERVTFIYHINITRMIGGVQFARFGDLECWRRVLEASEGTPQLKPERKG